MAAGAFAQTTGEVVRACTFTTQHPAVGVKKKRDGAIGNLSFKDAEAVGTALVASDVDAPALAGFTHTAEVFAFSPDGVSHVVYADGFQPSDYAHDMPLLLERR